jgi:hypothetical protein
LTALLEDPDTEIIADEHISCPYTTLRTQAVEGKATVAPSNVTYED